MTDNYNDDYREVIPEEEKTETTLNEKKDNEKKDNEKNNENTQVADTAGENSAEKRQRTKRIAASTRMSASSAADRRAKPAECSSCLIISAFAMTACTRPWRL